MRTDLCAALLLTLGLSSGCTGDIRETTTARAAEEQLLVSKAAETNLENIDFTLVRGRTVFVDVSRLKSYDQGYVSSAFFNALSRAGARMAVDRDAAEIVVEVRSGGLGTYDKHVTFGFPTVVVGGSVPEGVSAELPPLIEIGYILHEGWSNLQLFAYERDSGRFVFGTRNAYGRAWNGLISENIWPKTTLGTSLKRRFAE